MSWNFILRTLHDKSLINDHQITHSDRFIFGIDSSSDVNYFISISILYYCRESKYYSSAI